jgi:hypothetical protein
LRELTAARAPSVFDLLWAVPPQIVYNTEERVT